MPEVVASARRSAGSAGEAQARPCRRAAHRIAWIASHLRLTTLHSSSSTHHTIPHHFLVEKKAKLSLRSTTTCFSVAIKLYDDQNLVALVIKGWLEAGKLTATTNHQCRYSTNIAVARLNLAQCLTEWKLSDYSPSSIIPISLCALFLSVLYLSESKRAHFRAALQCDYVPLAYVPSLD